jgi:magnesium-transporting ATPase (P-type)
MTVLSYILSFFFILAAIILFFFFMGEKGVRGDEREIFIRQTATKYSWFVIMLCAIVNIADSLLGGPVIPKSHLLPEGLVIIIVGVVGYIVAYFIEKRKLS